MRTSRAAAAWLALPALMVVIACTNNPAGTGNQSHSHQTEAPSAAISSRC